MSVVSWKTGVAGNWSNAADWSTGSQPGWTDSVVIAAAGAYTVTISDPVAAQSLTISDSGASVVAAAGLALTGLLAVNAGGFTLAAGGVFHGGTLAVAAGGTFAATGGAIGSTSDTTTIAGTLALSGASTDLGIVGNVRFTGSGGSGPGTLNVESNVGVWWTAGSSPVNAAITIGPWQSAVWLRSDGTISTSFVLGPESAFHLIGAVTINASLLPTFVNQGSMTLEPWASDDTFATSLKGQAFTNLGMIHIDSSRGVNSGLVNMQFSSIVNSGGIICDGSGNALYLSTLTNSNLLQAKWGGVVIVGTLTNVSGGVLTGGSYEVDVFGAQGSLTSINLSNVPSITTDAANITLSGANSAFTLAGTVALDSTLTTIAAGGALTLSNGRTLTATAAGGKFVDGGTLTLAGGQFRAKSLSITTGGTLAATGYADSVTGPVINAGHVLVDSTTMQFIGGVANKGSMTVTNGALSLSGPLSGSGHVDIGASGSLILFGSVAAPQAVDFLPGAGLLELARAAQFAGTIAGFAAGDRIDLLKTAADGETYAAGALRLTKGGAAVATLTFAGSYTAANFTLGSDGHHGTQIAFHA